MIRQQLHLLNDSAFTLPVYGTTTGSPPAGTLNRAYHRRLQFYVDGVFVLPAYDTVGGSPGPTTGTMAPRHHLGLSVHAGAWNEAIVLPAYGVQDVVPQPTVQVGLSGGSGRRYPVGNLDLKTWRKKGKRLKARVELVQKQIQVERDRLGLSTSEVRIEALKKRIAELQRVLLELLAQLDMSNKAYQDAVEEDEAMMAYLAYRRMH